MQKVSVIIPTYNREKEIERSVRSVLSQTYENLEVIIVDDGSTDHTEAVIHSIGDPRIRFVRQEQNGGASAARNVGVEYADADVIAFQDSDDVWRKDKLQKQMDFLNEHPEYSLVYSSYCLHRAEGSSVEVPFADTIGNLDGDIFSTLLLNNTIGAPTILMRKADFLNLGGFDITLNCLEDWDFVLRLAQNHLIGYINEVLVDAYQLDGGISSDPGAFYQSRCLMIVRYKKELLERNLFDSAVSTLLVKAQKSGVLNEVQKMLVLFLS